MGIDSDFGRAFAKSQLGASTTLPLSGLCSSQSKMRISQPLCQFAELVELWLHHRQQLVARKRHYKRQAWRQRA